MEEEILRAETGYESITHIPWGARIGVVRKITRKSTTILHSGYTSTF